MADESLQPGFPQPLAAPVGDPPAETAIRPGSPGLPADVVTSTRLQPSPPKIEKSVEVKDAWGEFIETIVFVVVLVFMLKTFLAEAFVIPTGSMATTLLGDHKDIVCEQCAYEYRVNGSGYTQPQERFPKVDVTTSDCPNCEFRNRVPVLVGDRK